MSVVMTEGDFMSMGNNRGGVLKGVGVWEENRTAPCIQPFDNFVVNYKGDVMPCCVISGTSKELDEFIVGNVYKDSIFDIYCGPAMSAWRRSLMVEGQKNHPCNSCAEKWGGFPVNWKDVSTAALAAVGMPAPAEVAAPLQTAAHG